MHFMKKCFWLERGAWKWWSWRVAGGSWVAVWWSWVALGGSWVAPGSLLAAVGSTSRFHSRFAGCWCGSQQTLMGGAGGKAPFALPPSRLSTIEKQGLQDQQDQQGQTWAARVARGPAGTTWAARVARDSFPNGPARLVAPEGPADIYIYICIYVYTHIYMYVLILIKYIYIYIYIHRHVFFIFMHVHVYIYAYLYIYR